MPERGFHLGDGLRRVRDIVKRGFGHDGPDRDTLLLIFKSALAATVAWVVADTVLRAPSSTFAPFSALLMVQVTVSRSMDQSLRYALAVVSGVVLTGLLGPLLGPSVLTFALLMVFGLILGRWRRLGSQGPQVAVAALFAYSSFVQSGGSGASYPQLLSIAGLVVLGCAIGVIVNLLIFPPMRYRNAQYAVENMARSICDLLTDIAETIREDLPSQDQADDWRNRASELPNSLTQTRESVEHAAETFRYNPRRLWMRRSTSFEGHRTIVNVLDRLVEQAQAITRGIRYAADTEDPGEAHRNFLRSYADLVAATAEAVKILGDLYGSERPESSEFENSVQRGRQATQQVTEEAQEHELDSVGAWPTYGALQTDAHRLVEELVEAQRALNELPPPKSG